MADMADVQIVETYYLFAYLDTCIQSKHHQML